MKKAARLLAVGMAMAMSLSLLAGCGGTTSGSAPASGAGGSGVDTSEQVNIEFWTHYVDDYAFTEQKVADFNEEYAGKIHVEMTRVADDYNNVLLLALQNGTGPDIYADGIDLKSLVDMNYAAPLDELMSDEMLARVQDKKAIGNNWLDGHWYSLPFRGNNFRLAWNKDLFEAAGLDPESPPTTYEEVIEAAKVITEYGKTQNPQKYGFMLPTGEDWIWWIYGLNMARVNGDTYYDYATGQFNWEAVRPVMERYLQLQEDGSLFPGGTTMQNDPARAQFSAGNVGMIIAASWDIGVFNDQFPAQCEWDVTTLPNIDGELHGYCQLDGSTYLLINGGSSDAEQQAAMTFYEYLLSEETLVEYYEGGYGIPVYDGVAEQVDEMPTKPGFAGFADISMDRTYQNEPPVRLEGDSYGAVLNSVLEGAVDLDTAIEDLNTRYNGAIEKDVADGEYKIEDYIIPGYTALNPAGDGAAE